MVPGRLGFCCTFVSPADDAEEERALNMRAVTMGYLARRSPAEAFDKLAEVARHNLDALDRQIAWVAALPREERMFRILSNFLPGWSHPTARPLWADADLRTLVERRLATAGEAARAADVRLSMHPGQHAVLATNRPEALANALIDIADHVEMFQMMGYSGGWHPGGAHINIHAGAAAAGLEGLSRGIDALPAAALDLLTLENDEFCFGLDDLLRVADRLAIVLDFHHHWIKSAGEYLTPDDPRVAAVRASWRGVRPAAHISVSREALYSELEADEVPDFTHLNAVGFKASELRGHSTMMWNRAVNALVAAHLIWCDIEVEAKGKNLASAALAQELRERALV